jgi:hypothetical protein
MHIPVRWQFIATFSDRAWLQLMCPLDAWPKPFTDVLKKEANQKIGWGGTYGLVSQNTTANGLYRCLNLTRRQTAPFGPAIAKR